MSERLAPETQPKHRRHSKWPDGGLALAVEGGHDGNGDAHSGWSEPRWPVSETERWTQPSRRSRFWLRGLSGALAAALALLAAAIIMVQLIALISGIPGPGLGMLSGHLVAAAVAIAAQYVADRRGGLAGLLASVVVVVDVGLVLLLFWWI